MAGAVDKPGAVPLAGELDILGAIARAGGFSTNADNKRIRFTRPGEGERIFSFQDLKNSKDRTPVLPGDVIEIQEKLF